MQIRQDIADHTKSNREAFILYHKNLFLPLLPNTNYVSNLANARAQSGADVSITTKSPLTAQPVGVTGTMKPYQLEGLDFLVYMYHNGMSAILGDEMGLGKTLQMLSLFQYLKVSEPVSSEEARPFLVVCPLSVLDSWIKEAAKWTPDLKVIRYHGPKSERNRLKQEVLGLIDRFGSRTGKRGNTNQYLPNVIDLTEEKQPVDLVVTTYEAFVVEQAWFKRAFVWRYAVLDEGHRIKSENTQVAKALQSLSAEYRLLLTGTALQNNLTELWALFHWLLPEVFTADTALDFNQAFDLSRGKASTSFMDHSRRLLELIMLRRMKASPGVDLGIPPKEEVLMFIPLTPVQKWWYTWLLTNVDNILLEDLFRGGKSKIKQDMEHERAEDNKLSLLQQAETSLGSDVWAESKEILTSTMETKDTYEKLKNLVIELRKACTHPYLLLGARPEPYLIGPHVRVASGKFIVLEKLVQELVIKQHKKIIIFSGWIETLNMVADLLVLIGISMDFEPLKFQRLDGSTSRSRRNLAIRLFNDLRSDSRIMLVSTRAGGLGINLTSATEAVFMDEDWNPQVTLQAEARCHRIGQTKKVTVYKLCTQGTVEEQMMGRIRKKLYLSAKITESMRNIHAPNTRKTKRKIDDLDSVESDDRPPLDASGLKNLLRRGAQALSAPGIDVDEMLTWDWQTTVEKCKDRPQNPHVADLGDSMANEVDEEAWLHNVEKVETAVFEGKRHQRQREKATDEVIDLDRAARRVNKNTTVMVGGFAISKESMGCADWEAVPTLAGKNPSLAEPEKTKRSQVNHHQYHCQACRDGGDLVCCTGCPRSYHIDCLDGDMKGRASTRFGFYCPQHQCTSCKKNTNDAGGLIYRCRWCEKGFCEDCLEWDTAHLIDETLPELEMLGYRASNGFYIDCHACVEGWKTDMKRFQRMQTEKACFEMKDLEHKAKEQGAIQGTGLDANTPNTVSEVATPMDVGLSTSQRQNTGLNV